MRALTTALAALCAGAAGADQYNYQNLLVGTRSSGMGAADVAFADSVTGAFYNPAGIVDASAKLVSVSLSAYRFDLSGASSIEAREGKVGRAGGFLFSSFPLNFGLITRLGDGLGLEQHTLALNFFVEDHARGGGRVDVRIPSVVDLYLRVRRKDQETVRFGPSWAARRGAWSFGASLAYQLRVESMFVDTLIDLQDSVTYRFRDVQGLGGALVGQLGVIGRPWRGLQLGLTFAPPGLRLHGSAVGTELELRTAREPAVDAAATLPMTYRSPWRVSLGAGYRFESGARVGAQATLHGPVPRYEVIPGLLEAEGRPVLNGNLGLELPVTSTIVARAGAFTNLAASAAPPAESPSRFDDPARLPHVDYFGATLGLSTVSGESSMDLSLVYQHGTGWVPAEASRGYDPIRANLVVLMLGGTYSFSKGGDR